jgi:segregation and condensation protein B
VNRLSDEALEARIEAALYVAGKPLTLDDLCRAAGTTSRRKAAAAVQALAARINSTMKAIELAKVGEGRYVLQLKAEFNPMAKRFATQPLLTRSVLKTLTMVAYFQPVSGNKLMSKRGTQVYSHLRTLEAMGFVTSVQEGKSRVYTTTPYFSEYFGLPSDPAQIRQKLQHLFQPPSSEKA